MKTALRPAEKLNVLKTSLVEAIVRDNVAALEVLFQNSASMDWFDVGDRLRKEVDVLEWCRHGESASNGNSKGRSMKRMLSHLAVFGMGRKGPQKNPPSEKNTNDRSNKAEKTQDKRRRYAESAQCWIDAITRIRSANESFKLLQQDVKGGIKVKDSGNSGRYSTAKKESKSLIRHESQLSSRDLHDKFVVARSEKKFVLLEEIYNNLLGADFW
jgi:predicted small lipoprotein YifL